MKRTYESYGGSINCFVERFANLTAEQAAQVVAGLAELARKSPFAVITYTGKQ